MDVSTPSLPSSKAGECPHPLNTCYHAWEQGELSSEKIGESQRWFLYLLWWLCIYPGEKIGHNEIWTFKVKFDLDGRHSQSPLKQQGSFS